MKGNSTKRGVYIMNDEKLNEINTRVTRIETLLLEYNHNLETVNRRLDRHSERLDCLERVHHQALGAKSTLIWVAATMISSVGAACAVASQLAK